MATKNNANVLRIINDHLDLMYRPGMTVTEALEAAQCSAMNDRKGPDDLDGRDAEYYLKARWMISREKNLGMKMVKSVGGVGLTHLYNFSKGLARLVGLERYTRTDADVPTTPPGGSAWVQRGASDGMRDDGAAIQKPAYATSLSLLVTH